MIRQIIGVLMILTIMGHAQYIQWSPANQAAKLRPFKAVPTYVSFQLDIYDLSPDSAYFLAVESPDFLPDPMSIQWNRRQFTPVMAFKRSDGEPLLYTVQLDDSPGTDRTMVGIDLNGCCHVTQMVHAKVAGRQVWEPGTYHASLRFHLFEDTADPLGVPLLLDSVELPMSVDVEPYIHYTVTANAELREVYVHVLANTPYIIQKTTQDLITYKPKMITVSQPKTPWLGTRITWPLTDEDIATNNEQYLINISVMPQP